jgi:hypothetical protein
MAEPATQPAATGRHPYKGSCHCGNVRYIVYLTFPHTPPPSRQQKGHQSFYRCNCTICHKSGFLHARVRSSPDDFLLLSPGDPYRDLGDYQCDGGYLHFFYCKKCAVRCFIFMGQGETVEVDDDAVLSMLGSGDKTVTAWRPKKEGWQEGRLQHGCYLSVNALTIDPGQKSFDLREWTEKKWMLYLDVLRSGEDGAGHPSYDRPHPGGSY